MTAYFQVLKVGEGLHAIQRTAVTTLNPQLLSETMWPTTFTISDVALLATTNDPNLVADKQCRDRKDSSSWVWYRTTVDAWIHWECLANQRVAAWAQPA